MNPFKKMKFNTVSITLQNSLHSVATAYCTLHYKAFSKIIHNIKIKQLHLKDTSDNKVAQIYIKTDNQKLSFCHLATFPFYLSPIFLFII